MTIAFDQPCPLAMPNSIQSQKRNRDLARLTSRIHDQALRVGDRMALREDWPDLILAQWVRHNLWRGQGQNRTTQRTMNVDGKHLADPNTWPT